MVPEICNQLFAMKRWLGLTTIYCYCSIEFDKLERNDVRRSFSSGSRRWSSALAIGSPEIMMIPSRGEPISRIKKIDVPIESEQTKNAPTTVALRGAFRPKLAKIIVIHTTIRTSRTELIALVWLRSSDKRVWISRVAVFKA